eukprot:TRINITY_DN15201_c0_g1_i1.p1 TRINITY_DN15201_c0_g1~~TRINITY_DN15201_c0_g1_i1.p1  ORF type:complete len:274 (+),score=93.20 TRINITY_DN15201_c0_g1_i1:107-823(+)
MDRDDEEVGAGRGQQRGVFFERQRLQLCAVHAVNNLLQGAHFDKDSFDGISVQLFEAAQTREFFNPHRSSLGLGFYDVNVIFQALASKGYEVQWFDSREGVEGLVGELARDDLLGLIVNVPSLSCLCRKTRHWIAMRQLPADGGTTRWFLLDSKQSGPRDVGATAAQMVAYLADNLASDSEVLIVYKSPPDTNVAASVVQPQLVAGEAGSQNHSVKAESESSSASEQPSSELSSSSDS